MDQENAQAVEQVTYFVIFKRQAGEIKPAYSYMTKDDLDQARHQDIIDKAFIVPTKNIRTPEETQEYLQRYQNESGS